jgi:hypothetical protein
MLARAISLLLVVLTRDGVVHRFDGHHDTTAAVPHATAVAVVGGKRVAVLAGGRISVDGKALPGRFDDVTALTGGELLWGRTDKGVVQIDAATGKRAAVVELPRVHRLAADGSALFAEADGVVVEVGTDRRWKLAGRPIALAAGDGKLWAATKEGPLWEVDRTAGTQRDLALGDWWGTLALAYTDHALYAVTVAGKLWKIDPQRREKTIVSMDGWQGAIDLSVLR